jgi:hypothetical protein
VMLHCHYGISYSPLILQHAVFDPADRALRYAMLALLLLVYVS